jgi:hypothetical protein
MSLGATWARPDSSTARRDGFPLACGS